MPPRRRIDPAAGERAYRLAVQALHIPGTHTPGAPTPLPPGISLPGLPRPDLATAVRFALEELASRVPGGSVELRVPPFGVTQMIEGPRHTRGTPPNVVETDPVTFLCLASGLLSWEEAAAAARLSVSGSRAHLAPFFPLSGLEAR